MGLGTITPPRIDFDQKIEAERQDLDADYSGWYCVRTKPFPCPADGCDFVAQFMTAAHLIIVWPAVDDRHLLQYANDARQFGRDPRVEQYAPAFGPCISYDAWVQIGRRVHGLRDRPPDQPFRSF